MSQPVDDDEPGDSYGSGMFDPFAVNEWLERRRRPGMLSAELEHMVVELTRSLKQFIADRHETAALSQGPFRDGDDASDPPVTEWELRVLMAEQVDPLGAVEFVLEQMQPAFAEQLGEPWPWRSGDTPAGTDPMPAPYVRIAGQSIDIGFSGGGRETPLPPLAWPPPGA